MPRRNAELPTALARLEGIGAPSAQVVTTAQARAAGVSADAIRLLVSAGSWTRLHRGVYLAAPGPPSPYARMWAAHLALGPASVVGGRTAARYWGLRDDDEDDSAGPVEMVLPDGSSRCARGVQVRRVPVPGALAHPARVPPVLSVEHTVLELMGSAATDADAVEPLLRACRLRITSPGRLLTASADLARLRRRQLLHEVCAEVGLGLTSTLERRYARDVERRHGLPAATRQRRVTTTGGRSAYRDVEYDEFGVIVELDGRLGHERESDVLRDQFRDNATVLGGGATLRFGWYAVTGQPCAAARQVVSLLRTRGWQGAGRVCGPGCVLDQP